MQTGANSTKKIPSWARSAIVYWWLVGAALLFTYWAVSQLRSLLIQVLLALFLSLAMHPVIEKLHARGMKRGIATGITMFLTLTFFGVFLAVMGALVVNQMSDLIADIPTYAESINGWTSKNFDLSFDTDQLGDELQNRGGQYVDNIADSALGFSNFVISFLFQTLTVSLFAFYLAADGPRLRRNICSLLPQAKQVEVLRVWELAIDKTGAYISSRVILAIASAAIHWLVFVLIGIPSPLALALWVGIISQFVPVIGTYISGVLPVLIALADQPIKALWVIATILIYQQIENYVLQPRITAQTLNMHPAIAFGGVLVGSSLLGATGAVLALPVIATIQAVSSVYVERHSVIENDLVDRRIQEREA